MSAQHTPRLLKIVCYERACYYEDQERDGWSITGLDMVPDHEHPMFKEEDARRLAACWNACEGLTTDSLENLEVLGATLSGRLAALHASERELMDQRDELLEALKKTADHIEAMMAHIEHKPERFKRHCWQQALDARAAITKATGSET